jgi:hypothetical protein
MSVSVSMQYVGFQNKEGGREYTFVVLDEDREPREYILTIVNTAFESHRVRYQDAPDICSLRLRRELAGSANNPSTNHFCITDSELADYSDARKPKPSHGFGPVRKT